jgi:hypothetical protein
MPTPKQLANLKSFTPDQDREAARINGAKGGRVYAENVKRRKKLTEAAKWLLGQKDIISDDDIKDKLAELGIESATNAEALMLVALRKASKGDVEALKFVRDTGGEAPKNAVELSGDMDRPVATMDLTSMTTEQLMALAADRGAEDEQPEAEE